MENSTDSWIQLFQDKSVPDSTLNNIEAQIMDKILGQPVDFQREILLNRRRKWGLLLAGILIVFSLSITALLWVRGDMLKSFFDSGLIVVTGWLGYLGMENVIKPIWQYMMLMQKFLGSLYYIWLEYSWPLMGAAIMFFMLINGTQADSRVKE